MRTYRDKGRRGNASRAALVQFFSLFFRLIFSLVFNILSLSFPIRRHPRISFFVFTLSCVFRDIIQILCFSFLSRPVRERVQSEKLAKVSVLSCQFYISFIHQRNFPNSCVWIKVRLQPATELLQATTTKKNVRNNFKWEKCHLACRFFYSAKNGGRVKLCSKKSFFPSFHTLSSSSFCFRCNVILGGGTQTVKSWNRKKTASSEMRAKMYFSHFFLLYPVT